jgi:TatD DNase family protein
MLVDAHCHFNSLPENITGKVSDWFTATGNKIIDSSIDLETSRNSFQFSKRHSFVYNSLGFHPFYYNDFSCEIYQEYKNILKRNSKVVALGEVGLDYKAEMPLADQEEILQKWLELAKENDLTVLIHHRLDKSNWYSSKYPKLPRILAILDNYFSDYQNVVFHCFSYSPLFLKQVVDRGGFVSFSLNLLRGNKKIIKSLKECPLENLLLETDSPYMRVAGGPSSPLDIRSVYSYVSEAKNISSKDLEGKVLANLEKVFKNMR